MAHYVGADFIFPPRIAVAIPLGHLDNPHETWVIPNINVTEYDTPARFQRQSVNASQEALGFQFKVCTTTSSIHL